MRTIDVGKEFSSTLATRNQAILFCEKFFRDLEITDWQTDEPFVALDFANVRKISPGFANEAFACFLGVATPERILKKIVLRNLTHVQRVIINLELGIPEGDDAYIDLSDLPELDDEFFEDAEVIRNPEEVFKNLKRSGGETK